MKFSSHKIGYLLLLAVFLSGVFGFIGMNHAQMSCDAKMPNTTCPQMQWGEAFHNIAVYKSSMQAVASMTLGLLLALAALSIFFASLSIRLISAELNTLLLSRFKYSREISHLYKRKIHSWISRFELSPSFA